MDGKATGGILRFFNALIDPRAQNVIHKLHDIFILAICGVICGANGWVEVAEFGQSKLRWFSTFLDLPGGIPSHDTFGRVFAKLSPDAFERCFIAWTSSLPEVSGGRLIAIDGKASSCKAADAKTMAAAIRGHWAVENKLHWQLDVSFDEDQRRIRKNHGAENFSRLTRLALNLLKQEKTAKIGIHGKRLKSGWDEPYLLRLLTA
jgi:hypothetical protein